VDRAVEIREPLDIGFGLNGTENQVIGKLYR